MFDKKGCLHHIDVLNVVNRSDVGCFSALSQETLVRVACYLQKYVFFARFSFCLLLVDSDVLPCCSAVWKMSMPR